MMNWIGEILTSHFEDNKCFKLLNELIEQLAGLTQDTRTHGAHFVMEGATVLEKGNRL